MRSSDYDKQPVERTPDVYAGQHFPVRGAIFALIELGTGNQSFLRPSDHESLRNYVWYLSYQSVTTLAAVGGGIAAFVGLVKLVT